MFIEVRLYATLRRYAPASPTGVLSVEVPVDYTVSDLVNTLSIELTVIHIIMINGVISTLTSILHEDDRLGLFPAVGGG